MPANKVREFLNTVSELKTLEGALNSETVVETRRKKDSFKPVDLDLLPYSPKLVKYKGKHYLLRCFLTPSAEPVITTEELTEEQL